MIRQSGRPGANPGPTLALSGDGHHTKQEKPVTTTTAPLAPTREEAGEQVMQQILDLLEYGRSQVLTKDQLLVIKSYVDEMVEED